MKKRVFSSALIFVLLFTLLSVFSASAESKDIVIIYENDAHCNVDGYAKLKALKNQYIADGAYVGVVSSGDYIQGSSLGAISQGEYIVNLINMVGYDALTLGNHEFDYRLDRLKELVEKMDTAPICCNFQDVNQSEPVFSPYKIVSYGQWDVAYVGITTPSTMTSSSPSQFYDENDNLAYSFNGTDLCNTVQKYVNAALEQGADYVVALSHLGTEDVNEAWSSQFVAENTTGIDVILDGHSHSVVEELVLKNQDGEDVVISSTGSKFQNFGKLIITAEGHISTELISVDDCTEVDGEVVAYIDEINAEYASLGNRKIGYSEVNLTTVDDEGNRIIRNEETNLGDFCADAFRIVTGADVGLMNGGGIRDNMAAGEVTFNDILSVFPWNNTVCAVKVSGQQLADMLELAVMFCPNENGSFQHVSGITFDVDISVPTSVVLDAEERFVSVDGKRRVSNIKILDSESNKYLPIDLDKQYTVASHNYLLLDQGGGATMFKDAEVVVNDGMLDVELLEVYITNYLNGTIGSEYESSQNRINIYDGSKETPTVGDETQTVIWATLLVFSLFATVLCIRRKKA